MILKISHFFKKLKTKGKDRLIKQNNLPLNFFVDNLSEDLYFYNNLHIFLMPYNIGRHFSLGTKKVKNFSQKSEESLLEDCLNSIQKEIIQMNFFMERNNFQYKDLEEIKKHSKSTTLTKHNLISSSHIFLKLVEIYYTQIFPTLYKIENLLEIESEHNLNAQNLKIKSLIEKLEIKLKNKDKTMNELNGIHSEIPVPESADFEILEPRDTKK